MRAFRAPALVAALVLAGVAAQYTPARAAGTLLRYRFTLGAATPYTLTLHLTGDVAGLGSALDVREQVPFTETVKKLYPDGSALLVYTFGAVTSTQNGQSIPTPLDGAAATQRIAPDGRVLSSTSVGLQSAFGGLVSIDPRLGVPSLPTSPVVVGSHWSSEQRFSLGSFGSLSGTQHYTVTRLAASGGGTIATIAATAALPLKLAQGATQVNGKAASTTQVLFDAQRGAVSSEHTVVKVKAGVVGAPGAGNGAGTAAAALVLTVDLQRK